MNPGISELILYACPSGALDDQVTAYYQKAGEEIAPNTAHDYMPHVTLTGFFHDAHASVPVYIEALDQALFEVGPLSENGLVVQGLALEEDLHYLIVDSPWCENLAAVFAEHGAESRSRQDEIRLKYNLHLSLAYDFEPAHRHRLARLTVDMVDPWASVRWQIRLYERIAGQQWVCHARRDAHNLHHLSAVPGGGG